MCTWMVEISAEIGKLTKELAGLIKKTNTASKNSSEAAEPEPIQE